MAPSSMTDAGACPSVFVYFLFSVLRPTGREACQAALPPLAFPTNCLPPTCLKPLPGPSLIYNSACFACMLCGGGGAGLLAVTLWPMVVRCNRNRNCRCATALCLTPCCCCKTGRNNGTRVFSLIRGAVGKQQIGATAVSFSAYKQTDDDCFLWFTKDQAARVHRHERPAPCWGWFCCSARLHRVMAYTYSWSCRDGGLAAVLAVVVTGWHSCETYAGHVNCGIASFTHQH
jgi:hypothetical protein